MEKRKSISLKEVKQFFPEFKKDKDHLSLYNSENTTSLYLEIIDYLNKNNIELTKAYYGYRIPVK